MNNELIIYQTEDGQTQVNLKAIDGTVWLIQDEIANLFGKSRSTITEHLQNIFTSFISIKNKTHEMAFSITEI